MRVLADTNLFISYLLRRSITESAVDYFFRSLAEGKFALILPEDLLLELTRKITAKPYLQSMISPDQADEFLDAITVLSITVPRLHEPIPRICRDPKGDYLLACAFIGEADYLVTGDKDLLVLREIGPLKIVSPTQFRELLETG